VLHVIRSALNVTALHHIAYLAKLPFIIINTHAMQVAPINFTPKSAAAYALLALIYATIALIKLIV
jgi:hypothetical protein